MTIIIVRSYEIPKNKYRLRLFVLRTCLIRVSQEGVPTLQIMINDNIKKMERDTSRRRKKKEREVLVKSASKKEKSKTKFYMRVQLVNKGSI